ncbi:MAG: c-type cytochrome [Solirubrobacterales bacterium]|nr:c-type cytochrome [Solirubrobacterales bacterium]
MEESLFYIAGGALIVAALVLSFVGLKSDRFPSGKALNAGIVIVALLVAATAVGAVELAKHEDEQGGELEAANAEADVSEAQQTETDQQAGSAPADTPAGKQGGGSGGGSDALAAEGKQVFVSTGCGSCHTIAELGADAQGTIGPNLDTALAGKDDQFIMTSIVDPSAFVEKGFPDGTMPSNYGEQLSSRQIDALTAFLSQTAGN